MKFSSNLNNCFWVQDVLCKPRGNHKAENYSGSKNYKKKGFKADHQRKQSSPKGKQQEKKKETKDLQNLMKEQ